MIHDYWNTLRGSRAQPCRTEFNPGAVPHALGDTFILNLDDSGQFNYRIAGSRICALFGHDMQGLSFLTPFDAASREHLVEVIQTVATTHKTAEIALHGYTSDQRRLDFGLVFLPLSSAQKHEGRLLGAMAPTHPAAWTGASKITRLVVRSLEAPREAPPMSWPTAPFHDMKMGLRVIQGGITDETFSLRRPD